MGKPRSVIFSRSGEGKGNHLFNINLRGLQCGAWPGRASASHISFCQATADVWVGTFPRGDWLLSAEKLRHTDSHAPAAHGWAVQPLLLPISMGVCGLNVLLNAGTRQLVGLLHKYPISQQSSAKPCGALLPLRASPCLNRCVLSLAIFVTHSRVYRRGCT